MAAMNQTYLSIYDILDKVTVLETRLGFTLEDLESHEELQRKMEAVEVSQAEEFAKIRDKNEELKRKLQDCQAGLKALANDNTTLNDKVSILEARVQAAKERVAQEEFARDTCNGEAVEQAAEKFKKSEEYATILATQHDTSNDLGV